MLRDDITTLINDNMAERNARETRLTEERNTRKHESDQRFRFMERIVQLGRGFGESMVSPMSHPIPYILQLYMVCRDWNSSCFVDLICWIVTHALSLTPICSFLILIQVPSQVALYVEKSHSRHHTSDDTQLK